MTVDELRQLQQVASRAVSCDHLLDFHDMCDECNSGHGGPTMNELTHNFRDAKGRCIIAGTPVHPDAYAEFERVWAEREDHRERGNENFDTAMIWRAERDRLADGIREALNDPLGPYLILRTLLDVDGDDRRDSDA